MKARSRVLSNTSKLTRTIILMEILLLSSCSIAYAETNELPVSINEQTSTTLSIDMAKEIAAFYLVELSGTIPELSGWENAVVEPDITFYDLEGNITAYSGSVENLL